MSQLFLRHASGWAAVAALLTSTATFAQGCASMHAPAGQAKACGCGDTSAAVVNEVPEVGPYARYLISQGMRKDEALQAARSIDAGQAEASRAMRRLAPTVR
ncbi:hypothetical protein [Piscinibacter sp. XHJ-5]|uniref:hypothetical protein n=1 Tax=Piscinibacter sp. XHJ-5 TaxID=3037797 RepID=UPI0024534D1F|nr:hypothetical protein [Piscinibacter sp. XHJ-5]